MPGGAVNVMGGNLIVGRSDLSIDTRLGVQRVGAVYNSVSGQWIWNFDITYSGTLFTDSTGAQHDVSSLSNGAAIPGTTWVKVDADEIKSKGGLVHEFDANGRLVVVRWSSSDYPRLEFVQGLHDGFWRPDRIDQCTALDVCAPVFWLWYGGGGLLTHVLDRANRDAFFTYHSGGRLATARDGLDVAKGWPGFRYVYVGSSNLLDTITNSEDEVVKFTYGVGSARVVAAAQLGEGDPIHEFEYFSKAQGFFKTTYTDPLGFSTDFRYDNTRHLEDVRRYLDIAKTQSQLTDYFWSGNRLSEIQSPAGLTIHLNYDANDDLRSIQEPSGHTTHFDYLASAVNRANPRARAPDRSWDSLGTILDHTYDVNGRLQSIAKGVDPGVFETVSFTYGSDEMIATVTDPAGNVTEHQAYGEHGKPTTIVRGGRTEQLEYDAVGNPTRALGGEGDTSIGGAVSRTFDADRNISSILLVNQTDGEFFDSSGTIDIDYRSDHQRTQITRPYGGETQLVYDALGRPNELQEKASQAPKPGGGFHADWQPTFYSYDALGRVTATLRPNGMTVTASYDALGRVISRSISGGAGPASNATLTYVQGRLTTIADSAHGSAPETYHYDASGYVDNITYPGGEQTSIAYDVRGRVTQISYKLSGSSTAFRWLNVTYDGANRGRFLYDNGVPVLEHTFQDGRVEDIIYGNGLVRTFAYEPVTGLASSVMTADGAGTVEDSQVGDGCSVQTTTSRGVELTTLEAAALYQANGAGPRVMLDLGHIFPAYAYDELSNSVTRETGNAFTYNTEHNRLLDMPSLHTYDSYDEAGHVTSRDGVSIEYNGMGLVTSIGSEATFEWDTFGRLISSHAGGATTPRLFGGVVEADPTGSNPTAIDVGDVRIEIGVGRFYRHFDLRHNVKFVTDDSAVVVAHYDYQPYGLFGTFGDPAGIGDVNRNMNFAMGRQYAQGLTLLGVRLLDSDAGRFLSPDPVYNIINQYTYTLGNPVLFWDPDGTHAAFNSGPGTFSGKTAAQWSTFANGVAAGSGLAAAGVLGSGAAAPAALGPAVVGGSAMALSGLLDEVGAFPWEGSFTSFVLGKTFWLVFDVVTTSGGPRPPRPPRPPQPPPPPAPDFGSIPRKEVTIEPFRFEIPEITVPPYGWSPIGALAERIPAPRRLFVIFGGLGLWVWLRTRHERRPQEGREASNR